MREKEFQPLIPNGFKDIQEQDLFNEFVSPFNNGFSHRKNLLIDFERFLNEFKTVEISAEVWIDGSFATYAPDPADIDVVFFLDFNEVNLLNIEKKQKYERLFTSRKFIRNLYKVEVFVANKNNEVETKHWMKIFGTSYDNITVKGIFRLFYL